MPKPVQAWRNRGIDFAAWENRNGGYNYTFRKMYKDKTSGEYKETKYLYSEDLDAISDLLTQIKAWRDDKAGRVAHEDARTGHAADMMEVVNKTSKAVSFNDEDIPF